MVNNLLNKALFLWGGGIGGVPLDSPDYTVSVLTAIVMSASSLKPFWPKYMLY